VSVNNASVKTDLDIWVKVTTTSIEGAFEYRSDLFDQSTIEKLYFTFESILDQVSIAEPQKIAVLAPFEKKSMLSMPSLPMPLSLVPFRSSGSGSPVFLFQPVGGNVQDFVPLVKSIDRIHPVFAFQLPTIMLKNSVEEMATDYIKEINMISPNGPSILIGASMSSLIALEVAQQLKVSGRKVEKLVVLDSNGPDLEIHSREEVCSLKKMLLYHFVSFFCRIFGLNSPKKIKLLNAKMTSNKALCEYNPKPYNGDLHLISSKKNNFTRQSDPLMGWRGTILGMVHSFEIEASQGSFINSAELAEVITKVL
jgi:hypothetical protein